MPYTIEQRKLYIKEYNEKNKEKIKEQRKEYREANKEKIKEYNKEYYHVNQDKFKEYKELHREKIKEQQKEYDKEYRQTEVGKKSHRISRWKRWGVKHEDFNALYEYYLNCKNCEECNIELQEGNFGNNKRCLDHDHQTGLFRNVLCNSCNVKRG
jgi:hypothetical protein